MRPQEIEDLRRQAEAQLTEREGRIKSLERVDLEKMAHELAVHQVELEIQNEELRRARLAVEETRDRYIDLFDFAPIGYFTLDEHNRIVEANLSASQMLGVERQDLLKKSFTKFINPEDTDIFYFHRKEALACGVRQTVELRMQKEGGTPFYVQMESLKSGAERLRIALTDITRLKRAEETLAKAKAELETRVLERTRELSQANGQLKQYGRRITEVQEAERKRIAFELHDDTAQYLALLKMELNALIQSGEIQNPKVLEKLHFLEKDADRAFNDVRRYSHELRPSVLEHMGLRSSLEQIADDINKLKQITVEINVEGEEPDLSEEIKLGLFRIAQESLNNARKHARASKATISLQFKDNRVKMAVTDEGTGFDMQEVKTRRTEKGSLGLISMRERAKIIGANLKIESEPGKGTRVTAEVKL